MATQNLEFSQAMSDFATMFPEFDSDVIEAVLRANSGAVDATIDALLQMSTDNHNEKLRNELDGGATTTTDGKGAPDLIATKPAKSSNGGETNGVKAKIPPAHSTATSKRWNPPILGPLPPGFLRLATTQYGDVSLDDEQFAEMLQNEEFMNELRWNKDFLTALEKDKVQDNLAFKDRLRNMGKTSRKKFLQLARVFTWQRNKKPPVNSGLLQEEASDEDTDLKIRKH
ncbi:CUE domain-containing protein 1 [Culicoides brevitarsis]|uniref:CUE domain-containing protein 1 n=1 Tax=Culicoides brevitarsis TaxID=469753 RepID=UPI00307B7465